MLIKPFFVLLATATVAMADIFECPSDTMLRFGVEKRVKELEKECTAKSGGEQQVLCESTEGLQKAWKEFVEVADKYAEAVKSCRATVERNNKRTDGSTTGLGSLSAARKHDSSEEDTPVRPTTKSSFAASAAATTHKASSDKSEKEIILRHRRRAHETARHDQHHENEHLGSHNHRFLILSTFIFYTKVHGHFAYFQTILTENVILGRNSRIIIMLSISAEHANVSSLQTVSLSHHSPTTREWSGLKRAILSNMEIAKYSSARRSPCPLRGYREDGQNPCDPAATHFDHGRTPEDDDRIVPRNRRESVFLVRVARSADCSLAGDKQLKELVNKYSGHCARENICLPEEDLGPNAAEDFKKLHKEHARTYAAYVRSIAECYGKVN